MCEREKMKRNRVGRKGEQIEYVCVCQIVCVCEKEKERETSVLSPR